MLLLLQDKNNVVNQTEFTADLDLTPLFSMKLS